MSSGIRFESRRAYAAVHIVMRSSYARVEAASPEELPEFIDWEATAAHRRRLSSSGFGIAEAMDTAQRFEIGWSVARRLIEQTGSLELPNGFCAGASTDQATRLRTPSDLVDPLCEQIQFIHACGGVPVILPMPLLSMNTCEADDYVNTYRAVIEQSRGPLFIHWLGEMFLPTLRGYFPGNSFLRVMAIDPSKVRGAKISLLDPAREVELRRAIARDEQILLTGDDFNFATLLAGGEDGASIAPETAKVAVGDERVASGDFSHALLGILDGIAMPAARALQHLDRRDYESYMSIMRPLEALSRVIFEPPTNEYKVGLAFLSWLNGDQDNPMLVNHLERSRSRDHLARVARAASAAGAIEDNELTETRLSAYLDGR